MKWILTKVFYFLFNHNLPYPGWLDRWEQRNAWLSSFPPEVRARARRVALIQAVKK